MVSDCPIIHWAVPVDVPRDWNCSIVNGVHRIIKWLELEGTVVSALLPWVEASPAAKGRKDEWLWNGFCLKINNMLNICLENRLWRESNRSLALQ